MSTRVDQRFEFRRPGGTPTSHDLLRNTALRALGAALFLAWATPCAQAQPFNYDSLSLYPNSQRIENGADISTPVGASLNYQSIPGGNAGQSLNLETLSFVAAAAVTLPDGAVSHTIPLNTYNVHVVLARVENGYVTPLGFVTFSPSQYAAHYLSGNVGAYVPAQFDFSLSGLTAFTGVSLNGTELYLGWAFGGPSDAITYGLSVAGSSPGYVLNYAGPVVANNLVPGGFACAISGTIFSSIPSLNIQLSGANVVQLTWPTNAPSYLLESADQLPALTWNTVTNTPVTLGDHFAVNLGVSGTQKYFRLHHP